MHVLQLCRDHTPQYLYIRRVPEKVPPYFLPLTLSIVVQFLIFFFHRQT